MSIITNSYFIVKVKYTKQLENGAFKRVTEPYLVAGFSFTDAEASIYENLGNVIRGEFMVTDIKRVDYHDIFDETNGCADKYFIAKISFDNVDVDSDKSKKVTHTLLIGASTIEEATETLKDELKTLLVDYIIVSITETKIVEIFTMKENLDKEISRQKIEFSSNNEVIAEVEFLADGSEGDSEEVDS